ncbi:hypothetical protein [Cryobacterium cryoconiti]|uniref:Uncharacterized protein n=1 Tax=Cryobacterium cryoconiti TaxID=1259239 RepID=A0A4Y8JU43_9MICO|nr:hypothetical protein [Cryobacterium cryoconiti]TFD27517.1 hypothetical protein E3T49_13325 [Cryobacterium cryoconiti]
MARLSTFVHVHVGGESKVYGPDDVIPDGIAALITNPKVWAEAPTEGAPATSVPATGVAGAPPRAGAGSGAAVWLAYAVSLGIEVPEKASKKDILDLVDAFVAPAAAPAETPAAENSIPAKDADVATWRAYADAQGFETDDDVSVAEIIATLDANSTATE